MFPVTQEVQASLFQLTKVNISTRLSDCSVLSVFCVFFYRRWFCFYAAASETGRSLRRREPASRVSDLYTRHDDDDDAASDVRLECQ